MKPRHLKTTALGACLVGLLVTGALRAQGESYSHARIVRLSFTEGTVTVQRPDVSEWSTAPVNTPIQEGFKISTAAGSFAEVEFENGSTARLGEQSLLEFTQLALSPAGDKVNRLALDQGYATFNFAPEHEDTYEVKTVDTTILPYGKTMFRVDLESGLVRVAVFRGAIDVSSPYGTGTLAKDTTLEIRPGAERPFEVSQGITKDDWDAWVEQRQDAEVTVRRKHTPGFYPADSSALLYGSDDLWNYGNWSYLPGFGYGWAPIVPAGWVPYGYGRWCWYPGFGYTWISAEPWGWLPYHYGNWTYVDGMGWWWLPGSFTSWSPGLVTWYQGPGWVGWAPQTPKVPRVTGGAGGGSAVGSPVRTGVGRNTCPSPQACVTAVSLTALQDGKSVGPGTTLTVDLRQGQMVERPDIPPTRLASLPGFPHPSAAAQSGIAFDPASGRFVNSHSSNPVVVTTTPTGAVRAEGARTESAVAPSVAAAPASSVAAAEASVSAKGESPARAGIAPRPAPKEPPAVAQHNVGPESESGRGAGTSTHSFWGRSSNSSGSSDSSGRSASSGHWGGASEGRSSAGSSHESAGAGHGGFSGGGGGGGGSAGGHASSSHR